MTFINLVSPITVAILALIGYLAVRFSVRAIEEEHHRAELRKSFDRHLMSQ